MQLDVGTEPYLLQGNLRKNGKKIHDIGPHYFLAYPNVHLC